MDGFVFRQQSQDGAGVIADAIGGAWAVALGGNPLDDTWGERARFDELLAGSVKTKRFIIWSGTPADELFAPDPTIWRPEHRERFNAFVDNALAKMADGIELLIRPHARHIISDIPSVRTFAAEREDVPVGILLDPSSMLEPSMLETAREHFERIAHGALPSSNAVLLSGIRRVRTLGTELAPCPLDEGEMDASLYERFTSQVDRPVIAFA